MSGFLDRMAARTQGVPVAGTPSVHLRRRARFEPAAGDAAADPGAAAIVQAVRSTGTPRRGVVPAVESGAHRRPAADEPRRPTAPHPDATAAGVPEVDHKVVREVAHRPPAEGDATPVVRIAPGEPTERTADSVPRRPMAHPSDPHPPPMEAPDPLVIVRDRVVPVLVEARVLNAAEEVEVVDAAAPASTSAGLRSSVQLRVDTTRPTDQSRHDHADAGPWDAPGRAADIHVHIGRIEVIRTPAPPPALAAAHRNTPAVDHAAYLARRRELR